jgi:hypothetical protein
MNFTFMTGFGDAEENADGNLWMRAAGAGFTSGSAAALLVSC